MINVVCIGHEYTYELMELVKLFFPPEEINIVVKDTWGDFEANQGEAILITKVMLDDKHISVYTSLQGKGYSIDHGDEAINNGNNIHNTKKLSKHLIKKSVYKLLSKYTNKELPWGILTGIRPTKLVHEMMEKGLDDNEIIINLTEGYFLDADKAILLLQVAKKEHPIIYPIKEDMVSMYISIPFCPSRCIYCSFPSNILDKFKHLQQPYVDSLIVELEKTSSMLKKHGKCLETIYIGGGTPSTLTPAQMKQLLMTIKNSFDLSQLKEYTFEAGRPDTIDAEKLKILKDMEINRLSINPQTMNDCTLEAIGRRHTVAELKEAYYLAKEMGFDNINMDLIIGLPGENAAMVEKTMEEIAAIGPVSLTVHTLAIKRASRLKEETNSHQVSEDEAEKMLEITQRYAALMGLFPYYMYRQKQILGHLENIGYCKDGYEGIYNIQIMEEKQTIIALGAGAVSKIVFPSENRLERVPNVKNLQDYIERVDEMVERKGVFFP